LTTSSNLDGTSFVRGPDGRRLALEISGDKDGHTVFLFHGSPGSRIGPKPNDASLREMGVQLVTYDRPGYGYSDPNPGRRPIDTVKDMLCILKYLGGLSGFSIIGRSGGGPHALACAAELPGIANVAVLASPAPRNLKRPVAGTGRANSGDFLAMGQQQIDSILAERASRMRQDPSVLLDHLWPDFTPDDKRVVTGSYAIRLLQSYTEAVRSDGQGLRDDYKGTFDWGFKLETISAPTLVWYGGSDPFDPPEAGRKLVNSIPGAQEHFVPEASHFRAGAEAIWGAIGWCTTGEYRE
jgi:pimeloyl-ACP methyl ester carboxylesterase